MSQAVRTKQTATLLQAIYKNVKMAGDSILTLMPKVKDSKLKNDLTVQLSVYEAYASRAAKLLADEGAKPEEEGAMTKMAAKWGSMMNTMLDSTSTHIAEMVVEGATMGVNDMLKQIRECENTPVSESAMRLARDVCAYEEKTVNEMREYLKG